MELRQLEYLVAVAEEASFTRAAARVHISQSGVSAQIRALERELGAELIDRSGRSATLTVAGAAVLDHARTALDAAAAVRRAVDEVGGLVRGPLALGMVTGCEVVPWFASVAAFRRDHPGVTVDLVEGGSSDLVEALRDGALDVGLVAVPGAVPADLGAAPIITEGLAALVPTAHPLGARRTVTLRRLAELALVTLPPGTGVRGALDRSLSQAGLRAEVALQASAPAAIADLARRGAGVGVLSASMAEGFADADLSAVRVTGAEVPATLAIAWRERPSPAARAFIAKATGAFGTRAASMSGGRSEGASDPDRVSAAS